jgi:hypothetical protein
MEEFGRAGSAFNKVKLLKEKIKFYSQKPEFVESYF